MLDFPASPTLNQQFSSGLSTWQWDGTAWNVVPQMTPAVASDTPPANPAIGQGWWRGTNGKYYLWLDDGNSKQWVEVGSGTPPKAEPYPFITADMQLLSMALGKVGLNTKADGTGVSTQIWHDGNAPFNTTMVKFPNGFIMQYGGTFNSVSDYPLTFPTPFPTGCLGVSLLANNPAAANTFYGLMTSNIGRTGCDIRCRAIGPGAVQGANNLQVQWLAVGY